eukprot:TRINITY_DN6345_c0_g2_i2.p2 TRINITY_DN6345_c0_g2~~TRINITY_DN6345_c0_g2_i2.p2  ORF type:complete len:223 (-),score=-11.64 TRINITY_DN6345_c0_g2_i2:323-991(-)
MFSMHGNLGQRSSRFIFSNLVLPFFRISKTDTCDQLCFQFNIIQYKQYNHKINYLIIIQRKTIQIFITQSSTPIQQIIIQNNKQCENIQLFILFFKQGVIYFINFFKNFQFFLLINRKEYRTPIKLCQNKNKQNTKQNKFLSRPLNFSQKIKQYIQKNSSKNFLCNNSKIVIVIIYPEKIKEISKNIHKYNNTKIFFDNKIIVKQLIKQYTIALQNKVIFNG